MKLVIAAFVAMFALFACAVDDPDATQVESSLEAVSTAYDETEEAKDTGDAVDADADAMAGTTSNKKCQVINGDCTCPPADAGWKVQTNLCYEPILTCGRQGFCTYVRDP